MQSSFKIETFNPILIRSFVKCKHNTRCQPKEFLFLLCYPYIASFSSFFYSFFLSSFSFIFPTSQSSNVFTQPILSHVTETVDDSVLTFPEFLQMEIVIIHPGPKNFLIFRGHFEGMSHVLKSCLLIFVTSAVCFSPS